MELIKIPIDKIVDTITPHTKTFVSLHSDKEIECTRAQAENIFAALAGAFFVCREFDGDSSINYGAKITAAAIINASREFEPGTINAYDTIFLRLDKIIAELEAL